MCCAFGERSRPGVAEGGAQEPKRIDAEMAVETPILDRNDRPLKVCGNLIEWHVAPLFIEPEPWFRIGTVKDRVADSS